MTGKPRICDLVRNNQNVLVWCKPPTYKIKAKKYWSEKELEILEAKVRTMKIKDIHRRFFFYRSFQSVRNKIYRI